MIKVYAIFDEKSNEIYVGLTNNLERRLSEHRRGQSFYTKKFFTFNLFYQEDYLNYKEAREREKYLKSAVGKEFLRKK